MFLSTYFEDESGLLLEEVWAWHHLATFIIFWHLKIIFQRFLVIIGNPENCKIKLAQGKKMADSYYSLFWTWNWLLSSFLSLRILKILGFHFLYILTPEKSNIVSNFFATLSSIADLLISCYKNLQHIPSLAYCTHFMFFSPKMSVCPKVSDPNPHLS